MTNELTTINDAATSRMSGDERRSQILNVAIRLFSQRGFKGATTKEIARAAGVSEAMVFRHFATKSELYHAILDRMACQGEMDKLPWEENSDERRAIESGDDFTVFYSFALHALEHHEADVDFMRLLFHSALEEHELAEIFFDRFVAQVYGFFSEYIARRQREGVFREIEPRVVVRAFLGMLIHHSLNNILWDKKRRLLDVTNAAAARDFAEIVLNGIKK